jgi:ketosteroid isomerase-like protein
MNTLHLIFVSFFILGIGGCAQKVDIDADRAVLRNADEQWSKVAAARDVEGFTEAVVETGSILPPNAPILTGKEAIRQWASELMANPGFAASWRPTTVDVATSGDLGYTVGTYELNIHDAAGNPVTDRGKYVTVWKKQLDGKWKVVFDIFNSDLPLPTMSPSQ